MQSGLQTKKTVLFVWPDVYVGINNKYVAKKAPSVFGVGLCYPVVGIHPDMWPAHCGTAAQAIYQCLGFDDCTAVMPASSIHGGIWWPLA